jgi:exopolysaccharide production protein ExoF
MIAAALRSIVGVAVLLASLTPVLADDYLLGLSDTIRVKVVQWLPAEGDFKDWSSVGGDYVIGPSGKASIPFIGEIAAEGVTTSALAATISAELKQSLALSTAPDVTIEVSKFGPVYVVGDVQTPGEYQFAPNMNVIKAVGLAGGERHAVAGALGDRDFINAQGSYNVMRQQWMRQIATRARLDAELAKASALPVPAELANVPDGASMIAIEKAVMDADLRKASAQRSSYADVQVLLNQQIDTLAQKKTALEDQLKNTQDELSGVKSLAGNGLAVNSRVSGLEQNVSNLTAALLDIDTATLKAKQDISDAVRQSANMEDSNFADLTLQRQQADAQIAQLTVQMSTEKALIGDAALASDASNRPTSSYQYTVVRDGGEIAADETTALKPGDVVKVVLVLAQ